METISKPGHTLKNFERIVNKCKYVTISCGKGGYKLQNPLNRPRLPLVNYLETWTDFDKLF